MDNNKPAYKKLAEEVQRLQAKLDAIEQSNQEKTKFQLWLGKMGLGFLLGSGLKASMQQLYTELPANVKRDTLADVTTQVIWRFTRIGLLAIFVALIPTILLWQQNKLLSKQNEKIDSQIQLEESSRRGNLIVMMSNIMDKVDEELKEREKQDSSRALSKQLIGRIAALSYSFRPYRFWQDSMLIEKPLSPERGQLLLALVNSDLDSLTYDNIYSKSTFEYALLENTALGNIDLSFINLKNANLIEVNLIGADLSNSDLSHADLRYSLLNHANLDDTDLSNANLIGTDLREAIIISTDLTDAKLDGAKVKEKDWFKTLKNRDVIINNEFLDEYGIDFFEVQEGDFEIEYYLLKKKN